MSVKRYNEPSDETGWNKIGMIEDEDGDYVTYEDYARLEAENKRLRKGLNAATSWLGDTMRKYIIGHIQPDPKECSASFIKEVNAIQTALTGDRES